MLSTTPAYNLKIVLKEIGIPADTLRAWERRYGLPAPQRTQGGQRLYSQYDVEIIKWLMARQEEGLSISRAADLWKEQIASGEDPLAGALSTAQTLSMIRMPAGVRLDTIRAKWVAACLNFNESSAERELNKAFTIFPVEEVCMEIMQKGLVELGQLWYENKASVQQEHFASGLAMRRLDSLLSASPAPTRNKTALIGCPPHELHTFTALLLALLLRRRGLNVIYLGADVPAHQFAEAVKSTQANLVILVAQTLIAAASLQTISAALKDLRAPVAFGGRIFAAQPRLENHILGHYLGGTIQSALERSEKILKGRVKLGEVEPLSQKYKSALREFISNRARIEIALEESLADFDHIGVEFLDDNIIAALQFGDMEYATQEIEWVKGLLQSQNRPPQELTAFMQSYFYAAEKHLEEGSPITAWLAKQVL